MNSDFFNEVEDYIINTVTYDNGFEKCFVSPSNLREVLNLLKNNPEYDYNRLNSIICVDVINNFELIYDLHSTTTNKQFRLAITLDKDSLRVDSIVDIFKSAYFDECEIYDMFGVNFINNPDLKRLLMPKSWIGHPLRKDYQMLDDRLDWNKD